MPTFDYDNRPFAEAPKCQLKDGMYVDYAEHVAMTPQYYQEWIEVTLSYLADPEQTDNPITDPAEALDFAERSICFQIADGYFENPTPDYPEGVTKLSDWAD